jgi:hypothetical protein
VLIKTPFSLGVGKGVRFLFNCKMASTIIRKPSIETITPAYLTISGV